MSLERSANHTLGDSLPVPASASSPMPGAGPVALIAAELRIHAAYLAVIAAYALACVLAGALSGGAGVVHVGFVAHNLTLVVALAATARFVFLTLKTAFVQPPAGRLLPALLAVYRTELLDPRAIVRFAVAALPLPVFMTAFGSFKRMIPFLHPFAWDARLVEWDRLLHGGLHPWELLQPLLGHPLLTSLVADAYQLWLFVVLFTLVWQSWSRRDDVLRTRYQLSFLACWIVLGTMLAAALSSAGPCYYGRVTGGPDPFVPLMGYLHAVGASYSVPALEVQEMLWGSYVVRSAELGHGISAMPSMHVAISVLMALMGWRVGRAAGAAYTAFAAVIMLGSVHLGWHYALDGYVSAVVVVGIWWAAGFFARWWHAALDAGTRSDVAGPLRRSFAHSPSPRS